MAVRRPGLERPPQLQLKTRYGHEYTCCGGSAALAAAAPLLWRRRRVGQQLGQVQQLQSAFDLGIQMSAFGLVPIGALSGRPRYKAALGCCVFFSGESLKELHEAEDEILRLRPPFLRHPATGLFRRQRPASGGGNLHPGINICRKGNGRSGSGCVRGDMVSVAVVIGGC